ncbi:DNA-binding response regulator [Vallitalea longa]|uniref:Stage 0 sporulation protein A homolog n=1 Tax=Vallitalea longa TaxID=2936439 RepID=A0A9W5YHY7_9FIRM|nr:response regulator [Vallitalea longa]GKX32259.1 DNA-binding response regulator [Vallitalea longa]
MIKMMIVDDEPLIRKGFTITIDWESYGIVIVGEAANGKEALVKIEKLEPDIIVTDIKMPIMDGIDLSKEITKKYSDIKIIILSGYNEFEYAQQILKTNACDYLLKPVNVEELIKLVIKLKGEIIKHKEKKEIINKKDKLIECYKDDIKSKILKDILIPNYSSSNDILEQAKFIGLDLEGESYCVFIVKMDMEVAKGQRYLTKKQKDIGNLIRDILQIYNFKGFICYTHYNFLACILVNNKELKNAYIQFYENLKDNLSKSIEEKFCIGVGTICNNIHEISDSYKNAKYVLDNLTFLGKNSVVFYDNKDSNINKYKKIVKVAIDYVYANYDRNITLAQVAEFVLISPNYFSKIFKEETNKNFIDWLNELRIHKAKNLLKDPLLKIYEVAEKVGYSDYKYFSYNFKKYTGISAKDYREKNN